MIYLIIGPSCSGKTQIVTNSFIGNSEISCYKDLVKITKSDTSLLIGDYTSNNKVRGTDRISRSQLKLIAPQIIKLFNEYDLNIVAKGINVCWSFVLDELLPYKDNVKLIYMDCSKEMSLARNEKINPDFNRSWFKSVWTRSNNIFNKYSQEYNSWIIDAEHILNFSEISLDNVQLVPVKQVQQNKLF